VDQAAHELLVTAAPHVKPPDSTPRIMWEVVVALAPVVAAAVWFFGPSAAVLLAASVLGAVVAERFLAGRGTLHDGSAVITGMLLGLTLPPGLPAWMAVVGGIFGIAAGKMIFGGLGQNVFNPALLGRAFLQAAFPTAMTTWPGGALSWWTLRGDTFAIPFMSARAPDIVTSATPLGMMKFEARPTGLTDLMIGSTGGSIGETAGLVILACGAWLTWRGIINWRAPVAIVIAVVAFSAILHVADAARYPAPLNDLFSGGLLLGAVFMATDPVTAPVTNGGRWLFGAGVGLLVVVIRRWGGLPEGVMYAILIFNALVPFINQITQPRVFGTTRVKARVRA
jgi:electron transport complex protein RnfD